MLFAGKRKENRELLLVVGLGNPGPEYAKTRHNCGFRTVDRLAEKYKGRWAKTRFQAETARVLIEGRRVLLVKPLTFMNNSGDAVSRLSNYYRVNTEDILVIYDDVDITIGQIRIREQGGSGTHNGMKSLVRQIGQNFPRVRVGIGPQPTQYDIVDFVLGRFSDTEEEQLAQALAKAVRAVELTAAEGIEKAMNGLNIRGKQDGV